MRREPLRPDPETARAWERRSRRPLPFASPRRRRDLRTRKRFVAMLLRHRPVCEAQLSWCCAGRSVEVNELVRGPGREDCWLDWDRVTALCAACHAWITLYPDWASRHGHQVPHEGQRDFGLAERLRAASPGTVCLPNCLTDHRVAA